MPTSERSLFLIFGNCQGDALYDVLTRVGAVPSHLEMRYVKSFGNPKVRARLLSELKQRDTRVIWAQNSLVARKFITEAFGEHPGLVKYPAFAVRCLWPNDTNMFKQTKRLADRIGPKPWFDYVDTILLDLARQRVPASDVIRQYDERMERVLQRVPSLLRADLARFKLHDKDCDVKIADVMAELLPKEVVFETANHPREPLMLFLLRELLDRSATRLGVDATAVYDACAALWTEQPPFAERQVPIYPPILERLGIPNRPKGEFRHYRRSFTWRSWALRLYTLLQKLDDAQAVAGTFTTSVQPSAGEP